MSSTSTSVSFNNIASPIDLAEAIGVDVNALYCTETYSPSVQCMVDCCGLMDVDIQVFVEMDNLDTALVPAVHYIDRAFPKLMNDLRPMLQRDPEQQQQKQQRIHC
jgi:hypothetical protein